MIELTVEELAPIVGTRPACRALGAAPATIYRRRRPPEPRPPEPRPTPARALSEQEREAVLELLHSERFVDCSPAQVYATLLDEGRYLASERTMYRLLESRLGSVRERRDQLAHPAYERPELLAERPNELWSWDISKLKGPRTWTWFYLYVILDVFSRYAVGWTVQCRESAEIAKELIEQATEQQRIEPGTLTVHADRGSSMTSKPVAFLLTDLGVTKSHSRPYTSTDNPYSEAQFKTLKYRPEFPERFESIEQAASLLPRPLPLVQPRAPPLRHRPDDTGGRSSRTSRGAARHARQRPRRGACAPRRAVRQGCAEAAHAADGSVDQQARREGGGSLNSTADRLKRLDRLRSPNRF